MVFGAERFMGSSEELQECVVRGGANLLVDRSLDIRYRIQVGSNILTVIISLWCLELRGSQGAVMNCRNV
jgi:hypothetical protein